MEPGSRFESRAQHGQVGSNMSARPPLRLGWCPTPGGINRVSVIYKYSRFIFGKLVVTSPHTTTSPDMIWIIYSNLRCRHRLWSGTIPKMVFLQMGELLYLSRTMSWKYLGTIVFCLSHVGMALWIGWPHETVHGALHLSWYYLDNHTVMAIY